MLARHQLQSEQFRAKNYAGMSMSEPSIWSAVGTPLTAEETLHQRGLISHLEAQRSAKVNSILVGGSMGAMHLLTDATYQQLLRESAKNWTTGLLLVGVGDVSYARTRGRLQFANELKVDGTVALSPFFMTFSQAELIAYFRAVADESRAPLYLYDLPQRTGVALQLETVLKLAEHPNIVGIKCSGDLSQVRRLRDALHGSEFKIIVSHPILIDVLMRAGFGDHLDGVYAIAPTLASRIAQAASVSDWEAASKATQLLNDLLVVIVKYGVFASMTTILNSLGIEGVFGPRPHRLLGTIESEQLLSEPAVRAAIF
jgi:4-hydroxy-tetrahydrodipicolinate synthase